MSKHSERAIVFLVSAVQFVNILDFMMVMPLGPDFALGLGIPTSHLGYVGGAYTAAAALAGLAGSLFLDRFDRRNALAVATLGLAIGTAAGGFATGLPSLLAARLLAGLFGGPATSLSFSIIADSVPTERRGRAIGIVMGSFAIAAVFGVPIGLELALRGGWRAPFFAVAGLGAVVTALAAFLLPPMIGHLAHGDASKALPLRSLMANPLVRLSYAMTAFVMMGGFILVPHISAYVQLNLHYPRERIFVLYAAGGIVSLVATPLGGWLVDRWGALTMGSLGVGILASITFVGFVHYVPGLPAMAIFIGLMLGQAFRNVAYNTLTTRVPSPAERARFMSLQSAIQHIAAAAGAFLSSRLLTELPDGALVGIPTVAMLAIALTLALPWMFFKVENGLKKRSAAAPPPPTASTADPELDLTPPQSVDARTT